MRSHILLGTGMKKYDTNKMMRSMMSLLPIQRKGLGYRRKEFKTPTVVEKKSSSKVRPLKFKF